MWDAVVIGAGLAGLTAAQQLRQTGYQVLVVEKSRGLGGRLATRRVGEQPVDHGCRYLQPMQASRSEFLAPLLAAGVLRPWHPQVYQLNAAGELLTKPEAEPCYVAPRGMTAVAKDLAIGLPINHLCRVTAIRFNDPCWQVQWETAEGTVETAVAQGVIAAIPAPQILPLLGPDHQPAGIQHLKQQLAAVQFDPVITVMAGFGEMAPPPFPTDLSLTSANPNPARQGWIVEGQGHAAVRWAGLDSSKRGLSAKPVVVLHSTPTFAAAYLEDHDLTDAGQALLKAAAPLGNWLENPDWVQIHRWRYGFVERPFFRQILYHPDRPGLIASGDWCGGLNAEAAYTSGQKAATALIQTLTRIV